MTVEKRESLLGSVAVKCDTQDCHMEFVAIDEEAAIAGAASAGWANAATSSGAHCPECASGKSPAELLSELEVEYAAVRGAQSPTPPQPVAPPMPQQVSQPDVAQERAERQMDEANDLAERHMQKDIDAARAEMRLAISDERSVPEPFEKRSGATIPGVVASANDEPVKREELLALEKRRAERRAKAAKGQTKKTLEAMGGVDILLSDFDGLFGSQSDPEKW